MKRINGRTYFLAELAAAAGKICIRCTSNLAIRAKRCASVHNRLPLTTIKVTHLIQKKKKKLISTKAKKKIQTKFLCVIFFTQKWLKIAHGVKHPGPNYTFSEELQ